MTAFQIQTFIPQDGRLSITLPVYLRETDVELSVAKKEKSTRLSQIDTLAPFEIWEVPIGEATIKFHQPLVLIPHWLEDDPNDPDDPPITGKNYLGVECPELDLSAFGVNRRELWKCICGDVRAVWEHCVRLPDDKLSPANRTVKRNYLAIAEEIRYE